MVVKQLTIKSKMEVPVIEESINPISYSLKGLLEINLLPINCGNKIETQVKR